MSHHNKNEALSAAYLEGRIYKRTCWVPRQLLDPNLIPKGV